ncbi:DUF2997 domain-containing protein [Roseiconus lacunae]|uniref:DUF2997 domain-containing protein n=1 Tax=Roseiconus lacunae TaxID=2605694 RepID=UPI001E3F95DB|nr:DUF2997 domain-containing protein [Roseiconus lacunae]MCD0462487.1 DUF2997 domain-containing protein [Roseiconus lacunae]
MKTITITISPTGESEIKTSGFSGNECRAASRSLEEALGKRQSERFTAEYYTLQSHSQTETQKEE